MSNYFKYVFKVQQSYQSNLLYQIKISHVILRLQYLQHKQRNV